MRIMVVVIIACFNHLLVHLTSSSGFRFFKERIILAHIHPFTFELHPFLCNNKPENQEEWLNTFILSVSNCTSFCNKDHNFPVHSVTAPKSLLLLPEKASIGNGLWPTLSKVTLANLGCCWDLQDGHLSCFKLSNTYSVRLQSNPIQSNCVCTGVGSKLEDTCLGIASNCNCCHHITVRLSGFRTRVHRGQGKSWSWWIMYLIELEFTSKDKFGVYIWHIKCQWELCIQFSFIRSQYELQQWLVFWGINIGE